MTSSISSAASTAVSSVKKATRSVTDSVSSMASKAKRLAGGALGGFLLKFVRSKMGTQNLNYICSATAAALSTVQPSVVYLLKKSKTGVGGINHGTQLTSRMVLFARKLTPRAQCPGCKLAEKNSAHEKWMPSTKAAAPSVRCEGAFTIQLVRCSTCCCKDGLIKSAVSASLLYKAPGKRGIVCGEWFAVSDVFIRLVLLGMRVLQYAMYISPVCFASHRKRDPKGASAAQLAAAAAKCKAAGVPIPIKP